MSFSINYYRGKRVFVTGHTGFKGTWLCKILVDAGAVVTGYSRCSAKTPDFFELSGVRGKLTHIKGDIRDYSALSSAFRSARPEIVFHLAAQPLVRESYQHPKETYETNVMGTVNLMECVRNADGIRSVLNVTTDKVYRNHEWEWGYRENEELDGFDPYSNSKSCSELVTASYRRSFFAEVGTAVSTVRAGNVIGGGDFSEDRIIPDCVRAALDNREIIVRNPHSTRPYQHVLEPLYAYLMIAAAQYESERYAGSYNVGPDDGDCFQTGALVNLFVQKWGEGLKWIECSDGGPHEATFLKLDCSKLKSVFSWRPSWGLNRAMEMVVEWTKCWRDGGNVEKCMEQQIKTYLDSRKCGM